MVWTGVAAGRRASSKKAPPTTRVVTWNCQSVFPTHFGQWEAPDVDLTTSLAHNAKRYAHHVVHLRPYLARLAAPDATALDALCLQEVDTALVAQLLAVVRADYPTLCVHPPELETEPYHRSGDHAYHLLTLVKASRTRSLRRPYAAFQRFATTPLDTCVVLNAHITWVDTVTPETSPSRAAYLRTKHQKNLKIVGAMRATVESYARNRRAARPVFVCGDLNVSSPDNRGVYRDVFRTDHRFTQLHPVGESYNLKPENIQGVKTFQTLAKPPDDAVLCDGRWRVEATCATLRTKKLPVDVHGYVDPDVKGRWPSDHALTEVVLRWGEKQIHSNITKKLGGGHLNMRLGCILALGTAGVVSIVTGLYLQYRKKRNLNLVMKPKIRDLTRVQKKKFVKECHRLKLKGDNANQIIKTAAQHTKKIHKTHKSRGNKKGSFNLYHFGQVSLAVIAVFIGYALVVVNKKGVHLSSVPEKQGVAASVSSVPEKQGVAASVRSWSNQKMPIMYYNQKFNLEIYNDKLMPTPHKLCKRILNRQIQKCLSFDNKNKPLEWKWKDYTVGDYNPQNNQHCLVSTKEKTWCDLSTEVWRFKLPYEAVSEVITKYYTDFTGEDINTGLEMIQKPLKINDLSTLADRLTEIFDKRPDFSKIQYLNCMPITESERHIHVQNFKDSN